MNPATRIQELREEIQNETISYGELAELQDIAADHPTLFADDPLLAEWAGIPEQEWQQLHETSKH
jgi:hypothetical protein